MIHNSLGQWRAFLVLSPHWPEQCRARSRHLWQWLPEHYGNERIFLTVTGPETVSSHTNEVQIRKGFEEAKELFWMARAILKWLSFWKWWCLSGIRAALGQRCCRGDGNIFQESKKKLSSTPVLQGSCILTRLQEIRDVSWMGSWPPRDITYLTYRWGPSSPNLIISPVLIDELLENTSYSNHNDYPELSHCVSFVYWNFGTQGF